MGRSPAIELAAVMPRLREARRRIMNEDSLVELLQGISDTHRSQFNERRKYEWKVLVATFGIYAAVTAAKFTGGVILPTETWFYLLAWFLSGSLATISSVYLSYIHRANKINQDFAHVAEDALMDLSGISEFETIRKSIPSFARKHWSLIWQVLTIVLFAIVSTVLILYI